MSTDRKAPRYVVFSSPLFLHPSYAQVCSLPRYAQTLSAYPLLRAKLKDNADKASRCIIHFEWKLDEMNEVVLLRFIRHLLFEHL
jgi:hypothetical protein